jgi:3-deoxy-D-manno-octulosonic-acid transferase
MLFLYNIAQLLLGLLCFPLIAVVVAASPKYRRRIPKRLGWGLLPANTPSSMPGKKTIWVHALSVGEVTSSLPLIRGIRETFNINLVFSVTTRTGYKLAEDIITPFVDRIIPFPLDILPVVRHFITCVQPDFFILVETDFWPNLLAVLQKKKIPAILVNGRISRKSKDFYRRFGFFFRILFNSFSALSMQTTVDRENMISLGVPENRIYNLGNLKFDTAPLPGKKTDLFPPGIRIVAGSTHRGEEEDLLLTYTRLKNNRQGLSLVIAPRDISRGKEIKRLAESLGLAVSCYSQGFRNPLPELFVLDTIGELAGYYQTCDIAFVGGSLVDQGGHNPIEPAVAGVPVLFGPHMEDFAEVADDLLAARGALRVHDADSLFHTLERLLDDPVFRMTTGAAAAAHIQEKQGVIERHLELIRKFL